MAIIGIKPVFYCLCTEYRKIVARSEQQIAGSKLILRRCCESHELNIIHGPKVSNA
jgi:hypothetical protein